MTETSCRVCLKAMAEKGEYDMKELKFKLKKEGKCVGYGRFSQYRYDGLLEYQQKGIEADAHWVSDDWIEHDSIHPFVCLDRHGKEVYEGDDIRAYYPCGKVIADGKATIPQAGVFIRAEHHSGAVEPKRIELIAPQSEGEKS